MAIGMNDEVISSTKKGLLHFVRNDVKIRLHLAKLKFIIKMKKHFQFVIAIILLAAIISCSSKDSKLKEREITDEVMQEIYNEIKTPYKYGLVMVPTDNSYKMDCPSIFRKDGKWYFFFRNTPWSRFGGYNSSIYTEFNVRFESSG